ncbi:unnamed protein product [Adineta steineri]|uniref:Uncharacterized protein n=1 Tax=Adineta steineri TaxID=433720 RepID=A0A814ZZL3_9BILA|nr:unnamed protein product [Adineta steineri]CAF4064232.1 unnamed protein product [Adineta steineri]
MKFYLNQFTKNSSLCHCKLSSNSNKDDTIDMNLYNNENIQKYIENEDSKLGEDILFLDNINERFFMDISNKSMTFPQINNETDFNELFSLEDFPNDIFMNTNQCQSSNYEEILNMIDTPSSSNHQSINEQIYLKNNRLFKILHLSNLNKQITRNDLRSYFIGSTKTILKPSRLLPYLNYAFIFHRTNLQGEYNRKLAIKSS